ncbi:hypothetical protein [Nocardioides sp. TF02-7]|nr:hypothetical protein [Nocardioides sp. TF02-7]UMG94994.1 hypothetical protein MF408_01885 [Nocardioides sp. TF02-7]
MRVRRVALVELPARREPIGADATRLAEVGTEPSRACSGAASAGVPQTSQ